MQLRSRILGFVTKPCATAVSAVSAPRKTRLTQQWQRRSLSQYRVLRQGLGFTLVELVMVVLILGILAAVAAPKILLEKNDTADVVTARNRAAIQDAVDQQYALTGSYPPNVESEWFRGNRIPSHPFQPEGVPLIEYAFEAGVVNPTDYELTSSSSGAYWYNYRDGIVRARVAFDTNEEDTLDLYDEVNQTGLLDEFEED